MGPGPLFFNNSFVNSGTQISPGAAILHATGVAQVFYLGFI